MNTVYTRTSIILHWLVAGLIITAFLLGLYMSDLALSPRRLQLYSYHKWLGIIILALVLMRVQWRATHRPAPELAGMPRLQMLGAQTAHPGLYALMLAVPLSGWIMSSASGFQVVLFGVLPLPNLIAVDKPPDHVFKTLHEVFNYSLSGLVVVHVGAALHHNFIARDRTLSRMLPWLGDRR